jgi:hypothetical protein
VPTVGSNILLPPSEQNTLNMEAASSSETLVNFYNNTRTNIRQDSKSWKSPPQTSNPPRTDWLQNTRINSTKSSASVVRKLSEPWLMSQESAECAKSCARRSMCFCNHSGGGASIGLLT